MFEGFKFPRKPGDKSADKPAYGPADPVTPAPADGRRNYTPPQLFELQPGTAQYERAKVAFDLLRANIDTPGLDTPGGRSERDD